MQTALAILIALAVLGGGYYWYTQNTAGPAMQDEMSDPFGGANTQTAGDSMPAGAMMEDGTIPESSGSGAMMEKEDSMMEEAMSDVKEFTVTGQNFSFAPNKLSVKKGDKVRIVFKNAGGTHDWRLEGYNVGTKITQSGQTETIEFTADKAGTFEFYCSVGSHRAQGMVGTFTVTE